MIKVCHTPKRCDSRNVRKPFKKKHIHLTMDYLPIIALLYKKHKLLIQLNYVKSLLLQLFILFYLMKVCQQYVIDVLFLKKNNTKIPTILLFFVLKRLKNYFLL